MTHRDPVCAMEIDDDQAAAKSNYEGHIYYFCSEDCKHEFDQDPEEYVYESESEEVE